MTNINNTFEVLNSLFLMSNEKINNSYLCETIELYIDNKKSLYDAIHNSRRRPVRSVVWEAFQMITNDNLKYLCYNTEATSDQLKKWLSTYGAGYEELNAVIAHYEEERATA